MPGIQACRLAGLTDCAAALAGLPLPSLNQIASPVPSMMWLAPVPPLTAWWIVVAHRIVVGELLESTARRPAGRCRSPSRSSLRRSISSLKSGGLRRAVASLRRCVTSTQGNRSAWQPQRIRAFVGVLSVAIELLPHLIEAMHRARRVGVVRESPELLSWNGPGGSAARVFAIIQDSRIGNSARLTGAAGQHVCNSRRPIRFRTS